jgi:hypothetical protein
MTVLFWDRARLDNAGIAFNWDRRGQLKAFEGEDVAPANASGHMSRVREMANAQGQTQRRNTKANIQMSPSLNDAGYGSVMVCLKIGCTNIYCTGWSLSPLNQLFRLERTPFSGQTQCLPMLTLCGSKSGVSCRKYLKWCIHIRFLNGMHGWHMVRTGTPLFEQLIPVVIGFTKTNGKLLAVGNATEEWAAYSRFGIHYCGGLGTFGRYACWWFD